MTVEDFFSTASYDSIKTQYAKSGHRFFDKGDFNVNIFGFRLTVGTNEYDDVIGIAYKENGQKILKMYKGTTDPGTYYLQNPLNEDGCAILAPGQYLGSFTIRKHRGKYYALCQNGVVRVYRDGDLDKEHDMNPEDLVDEGNIGLNIHHGGDSKEVGRNSAGCQVVKGKDDFSEFMEICYNASSSRGNKFSYTLFDLNAISL